MRLNFFLLFACIYSSSIVSQNNSDSAQSLIDIEEVYIFPIEYIPLYETCEGVELENRKECFGNEFKLLVEQNLKIPKELEDSIFKARVYVSFVVDTNAELCYIELGRSSSDDIPVSMKPRAYLLDEEALRVVSLLKFTEPGLQMMKPVRQKITVPITFKNP